MSAQQEPSVLEVRDLKRHFAIRRGLMSRTAGYVYAVDGISLTIARGETLGLVGESGCGKSTAGKTILKLLEPTAGTIVLRGEDITALDDTQIRPHRRVMQIVFQDPYSSLNPPHVCGCDRRRTARDPRYIRAGAEERVAQLFGRVGLSADAMAKHPHEFSGGQRQRIGIARALSLNPSLIVCDEAVSALDVSIQAQVINLLIDLQQEFGLSYLFIAHDLAVVEHISHRIAVMYLGRIVELADKETMFRRPLHPYTEALLSAVPIPDPDADRGGRIVLSGDVPSPLAPPDGCPFHTRCPYAMAQCREHVPALREMQPGHVAACHLHDDGVTWPLRRPARS